MMTTERKIALAVLLCSALSLFMTAKVPPLTAWDPPKIDGQALGIPRQVAADSGFGYCQAVLNGVDCRCFARVTNAVLTGQRRQAAGYRYSGRWDLARGQAMQSCG